jgi:hypothetical protein
MKYPPSPFGQLSKTQSTILVSLIILLWFYYTDLRGKLIGVITGAVFAGVEFLWFATTVEISDGDEVVFKPFDKNCRKGRTVSLLTYE